MECASMSAEQAKSLYDTGAFLIFLDFPERSEFGIDCMSWNVGPKFLGVKMIPPGVHFVYYSAATEAGSGDVCPRIGFMHDYKTGEVLVKRWHKENEQMIDVDDKIEIDRLRTSLKSLDGQLAPYPMEQYKQWYSLTSYITWDLIKDLCPLDGCISAQCQLVTMEESVGGASSSRVDRQHPVRMRFADNQGLPIMKLKPEAKLRFHKIPENRVPFGAQGAEVTSHALDASNQLYRMLSAAGYMQKPVLVLAELQFAFVCFLMGQVYAGFEHWKQLVHLLCSCCAAIKEHTDLYHNLLVCLHFQLQQCPGDFFVDIISTDNFLTETLGNFFQTVDEEEDIPQPLKLKVNKFQMYLTRHFKWEFVIKSDD